MSLGLPKNVATALVFLHENGKSASQEIETSTGLRQPEVSVAMRMLDGHGWLEKEAKKRKQKGRPIYQYKLAVPMKAVISDLRAEHEKKVERVEMDIRKLENLFG